ncbi:MAG: hypothetical protein OXQ94_15300 [Gemmatimonadota bacterium]|nr:hypothetical protein [Gemmatimonadota bacterium]MDE2873043.1 hypothetical protein [Gemmatimonadota bacterium]
MSSSTVPQQKSLIAVFAVVMAAVVWPAPASAQYPYPEGCGWCETGVPDGQTDTHHRFKGPGIVYRCNTNMGCHLDWYPGECGGNLHSLCYIFMHLDDIESAVGEGDFPKLKEVLASSDNWDYDAASHALSFTCSGYTVARYVLPDELRQAVDQLPTNDRTNATLQAPHSTKAGPRS